jgi:hypothetical protein
MSWLRNRFTSPNAQAEAVHTTKDDAPANSVHDSTEKNSVRGTNRPASDDIEMRQDPDKPAENAQQGVQRAEAITLVWTKASLVILFISYVRNLMMA